jgi:Zn-dependent protease with chaperone function
MIRRPTTFATPRLLARERAHRRVVALSIALLFVFATSPVFGHHVAEPLTVWLTGRDHLLSLCVVAMHELMAPVHRAFHLLLGLGGGYAVVDRVRATLRLRTTMRLLDDAAVTAGGAIARAARVVGVDPSHVRVLRESSVPAFTAGLFQPVIFVAATLSTRLSSQELQAVIAHEDAHRRRRDPLRLSAWRFLACVLFFLPALRRLVDDMADEAEIAADD